MNLQINASNENSKIDTNKTLAFIPGTDKLPDSYIWTQNSSPCSAGEAYCYQDTTGNYQHGIENTQNNDLPLHSRNRQILYNPLHIQIYDWCSHLDYR
jgi:hypothetical protein